MFQFVLVFGQLGGVLILGWPGFQFHKNRRVKLVFKKEVKSANSSE